MLSRCAIITALSLSAIAGAQRYYAPRRITPLTMDPQTMPEAQRHQWQRLEDHSRRRDGFAQFYEEVTKRVERQEMSLGDAVNRVLYYCLDRYPEHLENVALVEPGTTLQARLGRNLLRGFYGRQEAEPERDYAPLLAQLDAELRQLCGTDDATVR